MIQSLYVVVVNWNLKDDTLACIESIVGAGVATDRIVVVDNGSGDGSVQALQKQFGPALHLIASGQNLGFAGGCNLGIQYALDCGAGWVLLVNNDTYVAPTFLTELENALQSDREVAVLGPVIFYHDAPDRIWYFGDRLIPGLLATIGLYRGRQNLDHLPLLVPADFVSGCGMLVRKDVFQTIGYFSTTFFMYGEDVDLCWRAHTAGFRLAVASRAKMWHKISASSDRDQPASRYLRIRNQIRFYKSYAQGFQVPLMFAFSSLRLVRIAFGDLMRGQVSLIYPLLVGWLDGWLDRSDLKEYHKTWNT